MFLESLMRTSIQGGIAILVLYLALRIFPSVSPKLRLWLWRLIFLKLVIGLVPAAFITLKVLPPPAALSPQSSPVTIAKTVHPTVSEQAVQVPRRNMTSIVPDPLPIPRRNETPLNPWLISYVAAVAMVGGNAAYRACRFRSILRNAKPVADSTLLTNLWELSQATGRCISPILLESADIPTAMVIGWKNPVILIPSQAGSSEDTSLILAHEIAHLRHRDLEWNGFTAAVQALFFFHPCVWLAARAYRSAQESAAEQFAIRLSNTSPRRYAEMLVRATILNHRSLVSVSAGLSVTGSTASMQQRLKDMSYINAKPTAAKFALAAILCGTSVGMVPAYCLDQSQNPSSGHAVAGGSPKKDNPIKNSKIAGQAAKSKAKPTKTAARGIKSSLHANYKTSVKISG